MEQEEDGEEGPSLECNWPNGKRVASPCRLLVATGTRGLPRNSGILSTTEVVCDAQQSVWGCSGGRGSVASVEARYAPFMRPRAGYSLVATPTGSGQTPGPFSQP